jgi:hypothetical protein
VLSLWAWMTLHFHVSRETVWRFESTERLGIKSVYCVAGCAICMTVRVSVTWRGFFSCSKSGPNGGLCHCGRMKHATNVPSAFALAGKSPFQWLLTPESSLSPGQGLTPNCAHLNVFSGSYKTNPSSHRDTAHNRGTFRSVSLSTVHR